MAWRDRRSEQGQALSVLLNGCSREVGGNEEHCNEAAGASCLEADSHFTWEMFWVTVNPHGLWKPKPPQTHLVSLLPHS